MYLRIEGSVNRDFIAFIYRLLNFRSLLSDMEKLPLLDGYQKWRQNEAANVSDLIQRRLHYLQNPSDCRKARKLICSLTKVTVSFHIVNKKSPRREEAGEYFALGSLAFMPKGVKTGPSDSLRNVLPLKITIPPIYSPS